MLEGLKPPHRGRSCKVGTILDGLDAKDKAILANAIFSPDWPVKTLSKELGKRGIQLSDTPISNHRAKACVCFA